MKITIEIYFIETAFYNIYGIIIRKCILVRIRFWSGIKTTQISGDVSNNNINRRSSVKYLFP